MDTERNPAARGDDPNAGQRVPDDGRRVPDDGRRAPDDRWNRSVGRRNVLQAVGGGSVVALAGCIGDDDGDDDEDEPDPEAVDVDPDATWRTTTLEDVTTGEEFAIADFDRPVVVHTFTRGCAACHSQQRDFDDLDGSDGVDVEIVDLTIDPATDTDDLRSYVDDNEFDWRFGVSPEPVIGSLVSDFGQDAASAARSPVVVTCPDGETYRLDKVVNAEPLESVIADVC
ncbi:hypothetical protein RBH26_13230 [Natronolimnohabitans sp. A-GB9]|uniref:hypothetical protein n=1 Tax=Natronolimnohabitans sp. A-GB9 TaxID=3069757 RepID=UPI0027B41571|nr:hypothetical protein [Natronolimnohabitans sp. A-GB9]MDQ2051440.1 hypothetical protein [Natronolimnohabitans sp. A-GB9]